MPLAVGQAPDRSATPASSGLHSDPPQAVSSGVIEFRDGFEDPAWNAGGAWTGDLDKVEVKEWTDDGIRPVGDPGAVAGRRVLALNAPAGGQATLMTRQEGVTGEWSFRIGQDFSPSDANRAWFFIMSDAPLDHPLLNGYAVRTGESGSDKRFRLIRFDSGTPKELLHVDLPIQAGAYEVAVARDRSFRMSMAARRIMSADSAGPWVRSDTLTDDLHQRSAYAGFHFVYSVTRRDRSWVDEVFFSTSPGALKVTGVDVKHQNELLVRFSHGLASRDAGATHTGLAVLTDSLGMEIPSDAVAADGSLVSLRFGSEPLLGLRDGRYTLGLTGWKDRWGGTAADTLIGLEVRNPFLPQRFAVTDSASADLSFTRAVSDWTALRGARLCGREPSAIDSIAPGRFILQLDTPLEHGPIALSLPTLLDRDGWMLSGAPDSLVRYHPPAAGDLRITELLFDVSRHPDPFIELTSAQDRHLDLAGWQLIRRGVGMDRERPVSRLERHLRPGGAVAVTSATSLLPQLWPEEDWIRMPDFSGLNRSITDQILLLTPDGKVSDSVAYDPRVLEMEGRSLERRSFTLPAWVPGNWAPSGGPQGATPGRPNSPAPDTAGPVIIDARFETPGRVSILFNEWLGNPDLPEILTTPVLGITPSVPIRDLLIERDRAQVDLLEEVEADDAVAFTITGIADLFGNRSPDREITVRYHDLAADPGQAVLIVTEFMPVAHARFGEYLELWNAGVKALDLSTLRIDIQSNSLTFDPGLIIRPGGRLVVGTLPDPEVGDPGVGGMRPTSEGSQDQEGSLDQEGSQHPQDPPRLWIRHPRLTGIPDRLATISVYFQARGSSEATLLDRIEFDQIRWGAASADLSFQKSDPFGPSTDPSNWMVGDPSPGSRNANSRADVEPPSILASIVAELPYEGMDPSGGDDPSKEEQNAHSSGSAAISIFFSEYISPSAPFRVFEDETLILRWDGDDEHGANGGHGANNGHGANGATRQGSFIPGEVLIDRNRLTLTHETANPEATLWLEGISDMLGNSMPRSGTRPARAPAPGDLRIHEILFDPIADPRDGRPDQPQFIELASLAPHPLRLDHLSYHLGSDETGAIRSYVPLCDTCALTAPYPILEPGRFAIIHPEESPETVVESRLRGFFAQDGFSAGDEDPVLLRYPAKTLSLANRDGLIILQRRGIALDSAVFGPSHHHRFIADHSGRSLEKIRSDLPGTDSENWGTSASTLGATPGAPNSIALSLAEGPFEAGVTLAPNPFSPDDDGFEDLLQIGIALEHPDEMIRIRIYDLQGRLIRTLAEGEGGPTQGTRIWDGRDAMGRRLPAGLYIVLVETRREGHGPRKRYKTPVILAGRPQSRSP